MTTPEQPAAEPNEAIIIALDRVNASLRVVLTAIAELKDEMDANRTPDVTPRPDSTWAGTP